MERFLNFALTVLCISTTLYIIHLFADLIHIPSIIINTVLALSIVFLLRAIIWKRDQI